MNDRIRIADFKPGHFARMRLREEDAADLAGLDARELVRSWKGGRTLLKGDEPVMIYGSTAHGGTVNLWAVTSPLVETMPLFVTRLARNGVSGLLRAGAHRIEVYCHINNVRSFCWLTRCLGFTPEGLMRRCGPNRQDRFLLAITDQEYTEE